MKRFLLAALFCVFAAPAFALTCSVVSPLVKDATGTPQQFNVPYTDDGTGSGDCRPNVGSQSGAFVDGWNVTEGTKGDSAATSGTGGSWTIAALLRGILNAMQSAIAAGANMIGYVGLQANTTGGCTEAHYYMQGSSTNANLVSTGAHTLCGYRVDQLSTVAGFLRLYDSASSPTCSSATGVKDAVPVQSNATSPGSSPNLGAFGEAFSSGLSFCFTNAVGDSDATNWGGTTNNVIVTVWYK